MNEAKGERLEAKSKEQKGRFTVGGYGEATMKRCYYSNNYLRYTSPIVSSPNRLIASIIVLLLHFFEEFGAPGGFPYMGVKILLGKDDRNPANWNCNNLSSMYGNWLFLILVYILPLFFPNLHVLMLSAMIFSFAELLMHLLIFNVRLKACYNPGMIIGVFMLPPMAIYYFARVFDATLFAWYHYVIAVAWFLFVFWLSFRSLIYWGLGKKKGYDFTEQSAFGTLL